MERRRAFHSGMACSGRAVGAGSCHHHPRGGGTGSACSFASSDSCSIRRWRWLLSAAAHVRLLPCRRQKVGLKLLTRLNLCGTNKCTTGAEPHRRMRACGKPRLEVGQRLEFRALVGRTGGRPLSELRPPSLSLSLPPPLSLYHLSLSLPRATDRCNNGSGSIRGCESSAAAGWGRPRLAAPRRSSLTVTCVVARCVHSETAVGLRCAQEQ